MSTILRRIAAGGAAAVYLAFAVAAGAQTRATTTPLKEMRKAGVEEMRAKLDAAKKEAQTKMQAVRADFQAKLKQVKDEKKKQVTDNLYARLEKLNDGWTTHFSNVLEKYDAALKKVESRRDKAQAAGNPQAGGAAAVNAALASANEVIAAARMAVEAQAKKTYAVTVTTEAKLREAFQAAHRALKTDLVALRDGAMKAARAAVQKTIQTLRVIPNVDKAGSVATPSLQ